MCASLPYWTVVRRISIGVGRVVIDKVPFEPMAHWTPEGI